MCIFCQTPLIQLHERRDEGKYPPSVGCGWSAVEIVKSCPRCGWWTVNETNFSNTGELYQELRGAFGHLRALDLSDISSPIEEVKAFLLAKSDHRFGMNPRLFEETVASVFRALGYSVDVTSYHSDGGIDAILAGPAGERIGVQVKRYRNSIEVEQIRAFTGALLIGDFTKGVFVTTSTFQSGAGKSAAASAARGIPIELVDWKRFYESLKIGTRAPYSSFEDWKENMGHIKTHLIYSWNA